MALAIIKYTFQDLTLYLVILNDNISFFVQSEGFNQSEVFVGGNTYWYIRVRRPLGVDKLAMLNGHR